MTQNRAKTKITCTPLCKTHIVLLRVLINNIIYWLNDVWNTSSKKIKAVYNIGNDCAIRYQL